MAPLQKPQVSQHVAARGRIAGTRPVGAVPPRPRRRSTAGAFGQPTQLTASSHIRSGTLPGAVDSTRGVEAPEAVDLQLREVAETSAAVSRAAAGGGPGPAGNRATQPAACQYLPTRNSYHLLSVSKILFFQLNIAVSVKYVILSSRKKKT
jgi:hypothetical protein